MPVSWRNQMIIDAPLKSQIPELRSLWQEAFGDTEEFLDNFERTAFCTKRCRCGMIDGKMAVALYWFDCQYTEQKVAYVYAVATAKKYRGQGLCHQLMKNTHEYLKLLGYEAVILVPGSKELFQFYAGMGYQVFSYMQELYCEAGNGQIKLYEIDKITYARLRRQFLPEGGVIQENENLDFLETQAKVYKGTGFLLAACREQNSLLGVELLGDSSRASDIVQALGFAEGTFRTPGDGRPFAMYYPLGNGKLVAPGYFGLAFD